MNVCKRNEYVIERICQRNEYAKEMNILKK